MRMEASYVGRMMWICHPEPWDRERVQSLVQHSRIAEGEIILNIALSRPNHVSCPCLGQQVSHPEEVRQGSNFLIDWHSVHYGTEYTCIGHI